MIIVMIMLVVIGLTSAAAIRNTNSGERLTNNMRMQSLSQQFAEAALRYCEAELTKPSADRVVTLRDAKIVETAFDPVNGANNANAAWKQAAAWTTTDQGAGKSRTSVPLGNLQSLNPDGSILSTLSPATLPECVAERQTLDDGNKAFVITVRGFSTDYQRDSGTGFTKQGSVVWLQSTFITDTSNVITP